MNSGNFYVWAWIKDLSGASFVLNVQATVPGYPSLTTSTPIASFSFQNQGTNDIKLYTTSFSCGATMVTVPSALSYNLGDPPLCISQPNWNQTSGGGTPAGTACTASPSTAILWPLLSVNTALYPWVNVTSAPWPYHVSSLPAPQICFSSNDYTLSGTTTCVPGACPATSKVQTVPYTLTDFYSNVTATISKPVTITCNQVNNVTMTNCIQSFVYTLGSAALNVTLPTYQVTPNCQNAPLLFTLLMADGTTLNSTVAAVFSVVSNSQSGTLLVATTSSLPQGTYSFKIKATEQFTSVVASRKFDQSCTFTVTVTCNKVVTQATNPIPLTYTYLINPNSLSIIAFALPTYTVTPAGCPFTPAYKIYQSNLTTFSTSWIATNTSSLYMGTMDLTLDGLSYALTVQAYDIYGTIVNTPIAITFKLMPATSISLVTTPASPQSYSIGESQLSIPVPTYTWFPTQSKVVWSYSLISVPSFVTLSGSSILVYTSTPSHVGTYTIQIQTTETQSALTETQSFTLVVKCVTAVTLNASSISNIVYFVSDPQQAVTPTFTLTAAGCTNQLTYTATSDGTAITASSTPISISGASVTVFTSIWTTPQTTQNIVVTATDPSTQIQATASFTIQIKCTKSITVTNPLTSPVNYQLDPTSLVTSAHSLPTFAPNPTQCPSQITYSISGTPCPCINANQGTCWMACTPTVDSGIIIGTTGCPTIAANTYSFTITAADASSFLTATSPFSVSLTIKPATAITVIASSVPSNQVYSVGQVMSFPATAYEAIPSCSTVSFSYSVASITPSVPSSQSLVTISGDTIHIVTSSGLDSGVYQINIEAFETNSGLKNTQTFQLTVKCVTAITPNQASMPNIVYYISEPQETVSPAFNLMPSTCVNQLTYTATSDGNALSSSSTPISIANGVIAISTSSWSTAQTNHTVVVIATDPITGIKGTGTFYVQILCTRSITQVNPVANLTIYVLNPDTLSTINLGVPSYSPVPANCPQSFTYSVATCPSPAWITCAPTTMISLGSTDCALSTGSNVNSQGTYKFSLMALDLFSGLTFAQNFFVTIRTMDATSITMVTKPSNQTYQVNSSQLSVSLPTYTWSPACSSVQFTYSLEMQPSAPSGSLATISGNNIMISTTAGANTGIYEVSITATDNNSGLSDVQVFYLTVKCVTAIQPSELLSDVIYRITKPAITRLPAFTLTPSDCVNELELSVTQFNGAALPAPISFASGVITIYSVDYNAAQTNYMLKVTATDPKTGITNSSLQLKVQILCTDSLVLSTNPIPARTVYALDPNNLHQVSIGMPMYVPSPESCPFTPTYSITPCPTSGWISCLPFSEILMGTMDSALEGNWTFTLNVQDGSIPPVQNSEVTFFIEIQIMNATSITLNQGTANQTYSVGDPALIVAVPTFTWFPSQSHVDWVYAVYDGPSFVTINATPLISIQTGDGTQTGIHNVTIRTTETRSGLFKDYTFYIEVRCVKGIAVRGSYPTVKYFINEATERVSLFYDLVPADCKYQLDLAIKVNGSATLPEPITFDSQTGQVSVYTNNFQAVQTVYEVNIEATDPLTQVSNSQLTFYVNITCIQAVTFDLTTKIVDFIYPIVLASSNTMTKTLPTYDVIPNSCPAGTFSYQLAQVDGSALPAFISPQPPLNPATSFSIFTQNTGDVGIYNLKVIARESGSGFVNDQDTFALTVGQPNLVTSLYFTSTQSDITYRVGDDALLLEAIQLTYLPANADVSFSYSIVPPTPSFVTLVPQVSGASRLKVYTAALGDTGIYQVNFRIIDTISSLSIQQTFQVTVSCLHSITAPNMAATNYYIGDPVLTLTIPTYGISPASCPYEIIVTSVTLVDDTALPSSIVWTNRTILIEETVLLKTGNYTLLAKAMDPKTQLTETTFSFDVNILCTRSIDISTNSIPSSITYTISTVSLSTTALTLPTYVPNPNGCDIGNLIYKVKLSSLGTLPSFISETPTSTIDIGTTDSSFVGNYSFILQATDQLTKLVNSLVTFEVEVVAITELTLDATTSIADQVYKVGSNEVLINVPQYIVSPLSATPLYVYTTISPTPAFVTITGSQDKTGQLRIYTADLADTGTYSVVIQTFEEKSQLYRTFSFSLLVTCVRQIDTTSTISDQIYYIGDLGITLDLPSYALTPALCPVDLTYLVARSDGSALPHAITISQTAKQIYIQETDVSAATNYTIQVMAEDQKTHIQSDAITFKVSVRLRATDLVLVTATSIPDMTYRISDPALLIDVPLFTTIASNANVSCFYYLGASTPAFVILVGDPYASPQLKISSIDAANTGIYEIIVYFKDNFSGLVRSDTFKLTVSCVRSVTLLTSIADVFYWITDSAQLRTPVFDLTPSSCPNELTYTINLANITVLPNSISFDSSTKTVVIYETDYSLTGAFKVFITVVDPKTGVSNNEANFNVTILCTKTIDLVAGTSISDFKYQVDLDNPWTLVATLPSYVQNPALCAVGTISRTLVYTGSGQAPTFISQNADNITVSTQDYAANAGSYPYSIVAIDSLTGLTNNLNVFTIKVENPVFAIDLVLDASTVISDLTYLVGSNPVILSTPSYSIVPTNADRELSFTMNVTNSFISILNQSPGVFKLRIYSSDVADSGVYQIELTSREAFSGLSRTTIFKLTISCVQTISQSSSVSAQQYWINDEAKYVLIPMFTLAPSGCPYELEYSAMQSNSSALPHQVTLQKNSTDNFLRLYETSPMLTGTYLIKVTVVDPKTGQINTDLEISVTIFCTKSIDILSGSISSFTYKIDWDQGWILEQGLPVYQQNPSTCAVGFISKQLVYTGTGTAPTFITQDAVNNQITVSTNETNAVGEYSYKIVAKDSLTGLMNQVNIFTVTIDPPTLVTDFVLDPLTAITDFTYLVGDAQLTLNAPMYSIVPSIADFFFGFTVNLTNPFISITKLTTTSFQIQVQTSSPEDTGVYPILLTLQDYFTGKTSTTTFTLTISCVRTITPGGLVSPVSYWIYDDAKSVDLPQYEITQGCPYELTYSAKQSDGSALPHQITLQQNSNSNLHYLQLFETTPSMTGFYSINITVFDPKTSVTNSDLQVNVTIYCTKSLNVTSGLITGLQYEIVWSQPWQLSQTLPTYQQTPSTCAVGTITLHLVFVDTGTAPTFINQVGNNITVYTLDDLSTGVYNYKIIATDSLTGLINDTISFPIQIYPPGLATDLVLDIMTQVSNATNYLIGDDAMLLVLPLYSIVPSDADVNLNFTIDYINLPPFIQVVEAGSSMTGQQLQVLTTDPSDTGIYTVVITFHDYFSGLTRTTKFTLTVSCVRAIQINTSVAAQEYWIYDVAKHVILPLYTLTPSYCPYELTYAAKQTNSSDLPHSITLQQNSTDHFLQLSETAPLATGVYQVLITVTDPKTLLVNNNLIVQVTIYCTKTLDVSTNPIPTSTLYTINTLNLLATSLKLPTYVPNPSTCAVDTITYEVKLSPSGNPPAFITGNPLTEIQIATKDVLQAGVYDFTVVATDPLTSLKNMEIGFEVEMVKITSIDLDATTSLADQTYKVSDTEMLLNMPQYLVTPAGASTKYVYNLISPTPVFVTLMGANDQTAQLKVYTTNCSDTGTHTVTIQTFEEYSQTSNTFSFNLLVTCVRQIDTTSTISDQIYYIGDPGITLDLPSYALTPALCPVDLTYLVARSDGSALPHAITISQTAKQIYIQETDVSAATNYTIQVMAEDQKTHIQSDAITFKVSVRLRATDLVLVTSTSIPDMTYRISDPALLIDVPLFTTIANNANVSCFYYLDATTPSFLILVGDLGNRPQIQVSTNLSSHTGVYSIIVYFKDNFSGLQRSDTFVLTVSCVKSISLHAPLDTVDYWIRDAAQTRSPLYDLTPSDCPYELELMIVLANGSSLPHAISNTDPSITIFETDYSLTGSYAVLITATDPKSGVQNDSAAFTVNVLCIKSINLTSGTITSFAYGIVLAEEFTKTLALPNYQVNPSQCTSQPFTFKLIYNSGVTPSYPSFITRYPTTKIDLMTQDVTLQGDYNFSLVCTEPQSGIQNSVDNFTVTIRPPLYAYKLDFVASSVIADLTYLVAQPELQIPPYELIVTPANADVKLTYTLGVNTPSFITAVSQIVGPPIILIFTDDPNMVGDYNVTFTATDEISGISVSDAFKVSIELYVITPTKIENLSAVLNASPDLEFTINALSKFTTNVDGNTAFPDYQKDSLEYTYTGCANPTIGSNVADAALNACCSLLFVWDGTETLSKANVASSLFCDGLYQVSIKATHPVFPDFTSTYTTNVSVKHDCESLRTEGHYAIPQNPKLILWPDQNWSNENQNSALAFTIEDPRIDVTHSLIHPAKTHSYSCSVQYEFVCPVGQSYCSTFSSYFQRPTQSSTAMLSDSMWAAYPLSTQMNVYATTSHEAKSLFDGKAVQINAYLFSTDEIFAVAYDAFSPPTNTPQYGGNQNFVGMPFSWTHQINISKNCLASFITLKERQSDDNAQVSSTQSASEIVQSPLSERKKLIKRMDLVNRFDSQYCLNDFNKFELRSPQLSDVFTNIFTFVDSGSSAINSKVILSALANEVVTSPTCQLSTKSQIMAGIVAGIPQNEIQVNYKQSCNFIFEVEAFIGNKSFGTYTTFTYTVKNECLNLQTNAVWRLKTYQTDDPVPPLDSVGLKNNNYMIWYDAPAQSWTLPKLVGTLASELFGYPSFKDECGPTSYSNGGLDLSHIATVDFNDKLDFPVLTVQSTHSADGGVSSQGNYKKTYTVALQAVFQMWPSLGTFKYEETRAENQPPLQFTMQDRCLGIYYDQPSVTFSKPSSGGNAVQLQYKQGDPQNWFQYQLGQLGVTFDVQRIGPNLYLDDPFAQEEPAAGKCGQITYTIQNSNKLVKLVWNDAQVNPPDSINSKDPLNLSVFADHRSAVGMHYFSITFSSSIKEYADVTLDFKFEVLAATDCGLQFILTTQEQTLYKCYVTPYNSVPADLVEWGDQIVAPFPDYGTFCPTKAVTHNINSSGGTGQNLVSLGCVLLAIDSRNVIISTSCINSIQPSVFNVIVSITDDQDGNTISDTWRFSLEIAVTPMPVMTSIQTSTTSVLNKPMQDLKFPDEPLSDIVRRWSPKQKNTNNFTPDLTLTVKTIDYTGLLMMEFNRPVDFNLDFLQQLKSMIESYNIDVEITSLMTTENRNLVAPKHIISANREMKASAANKALAEEETQFIYAVINNAFDIIYVPKDLSMQAHLLRYETTQFVDNRRIGIQLYFDDPVFVSVQSVPSNPSSKDQIFVSLKQAGLFLDPTTQLPLSNKLLQNVEREVPKLVPSNLNGHMVIAMQTASVISQCAGWLILVNFVLGGELRSMWKVINLLQFIVYTGFWNLSPPSNVHIFFDQVGYFTRLGWVPKDKILDAVNFNSSNSQLQWSRFLLLIIAAFVFISCVIASLAYIVRKLQFTHKAVEYVNWLNESLIWNGFIRVGLQVYLDFAVQVGLLFVLQNKSRFEKVISYLGASALLAALACTFGVLYRWFKIDQLENKEKRAKFGVLWEGFDTNKMSGSLYYAVFLLRRLIFALACVYVGPTYGGLVLVIVTEISLCIQALYLIPFHPNVEKKDQMIESMSEFFLLHFFYGVMMAETYENPQVKFNFGWYSVACVIAIMLLNLFNIVLDNIRHYYARAKAHYKAFGQPKAVEIDVGRIRQTKKKQKSPSDSLNHSDRKALFVIQEAEEKDEGESQEDSLPKPPHRVKADARLEMIVGDINANHFASQPDPSVIQMDDSPYRQNSVPEHTDPTRILPFSMQSNFEKESISLARRLMKVQENVRRAELEQAEEVLVPLDDIPNRVPLDDLPDRVPLDDIPDRTIPISDLFSIENIDGNKVPSRRSCSQSPRRLISLKDAVMAGYKAEPSFHVSVVSIGDESYRDSQTARSIHSALSVSPDPEPSPQVFDYAGISPDLVFSPYSPGYSGGEITEEDKKLRLILHATDANQLSEKRQIEEEKTELDFATKIESPQTANFQVRIQTMHEEQVWPEPNLISSVVGGEVEQLKQVKEPSIVRDSAFRKPHSNNDSVTNISSPQLNWNEGGITHQTRNDTDTSNKYRMLWRILQGVDGSPEPEHRWAEPIQSPINEVRSAPDQPQRQSPLGNLPRAPKDLKRPNFAEHVERVRGVKVSNGFLKNTRQVIGNMKAVFDEENQEKNK